MSFQPQPHTAQPPASPAGVLVHLVGLDDALGQAWSELLTEAGRRPQCFASASAWREARAAVQREAPAPAPALVLLQLPQSGQAAAREAVAALGLDPDSTTLLLPVSPHDDLRTRLGALQAGANGYLRLPCKESELLERVDRLLRQQPRQPYRVLLIDDDARMVELHAAILNDAGIVVRGLSDPMRALEAVDEFRPDLVLLDVFMPEVSGLELAALLREREAELPVLFLSSDTDPRRQLQALALGGDDYLTKPVHGDHLVAAVKARARRVRVSAGVKRQLELTLVKREREHEAIDQHALVTIADADGRIIYANERFCATSGYARSELLGRRHSLFKSGLHADSFYADMWRQLLRGEVWQGEICNRRKDGSLYWIETTITPFLDEQGRPYQYVAIRTDISHVKAAEQALRENEQRHRQTLDCAELAALSWDIVSGELSFNERWAELRGRSAAEVKPHLDSWVQGIHPDDAPAAQALLEAHLAGESPMFQAEYRVRTAQGGWRWLLARGAVVARSADGRPLRMSGTEMDISDRKRIEQGARDDKERLRRAQIFANIGTWEWNVQTGDLYWSERIAPLFGYPAGELETSYENFINAVHPDDRVAVQQAVTDCVERDARYNIEHRVVWPDGSVRWLHESGAVVRDDQGRPLQMLGVVQDIHVRKCAEMALAERERQLSEAQALAGLGNWSVDLETGNHYWSDEVYHIFGRSRTNYRPSVERFFEAVHPDDRHLVMPDFARGFGGLGVGAHDVVHRILRPDGVVRHVHELAESEIGADGVVVRIRGTVQDITERVEAEARLRESEERFVFAVEGAGDGVWDWDMPSGAMRFSRLYMEMLGYTEFELPHHVDTWAASVHPADKARVERRLSDYLEGREPNYAVELRLRCKDGSYKWILCRGHLVARDPQDRPQRMIGIHSDITERKKAELALVESQAKLSGLFELSPLGIVLTDMAGRITEFNEAYRAITGYSAEALLQLDYWTLTPAEYMQQEEVQLQSLHQHGRYGPYEKTYLRRDGGRVPVRLNGIVVQAQSGESMIWSIVEDISDRRRAEQALIEARDQAQRANQAKSDFLSAMSHELRTPLNAILGFSQLMEIDERLPAEHRDSTTEILKAGRHLLSLINEVLDLARVESGQLQLSMQAVEVQPVLDECLSLVSPQAAHCGVTVERAHAPGLCVWADRIRLKQVLLNLLSNAIKYNRRGGSVRVQAQVPGGERLRLSVIDDGPGIASERIEELFQPFNRLGAERSEVEGTGIGLTITRRIVQSMGGSVDVESQVGVGSHFWIELQRCAPIQPGGESVQAATRPDQDAAVARPRARELLYVEDSAGNVRLVEQILAAREDLTLRVAATPSQGLALVRQHRPDLILLDINLPEMDGYELLAAIRRDTGLDGIPVLALTANAMPDEIERGRKAGFAAYLTKPLNVRELLEAIDHCLPAAQEE